MLCLPKQFADAFLSKIKDGTITPDKLSTMSSADRETMLKDIVGEDNARPINAFIETKLAAQTALEARWLSANKEDGLDDLTDSQKNQLLKLQQSRLITAAREIAGLKPSVRTDFVAKIDKMSDILTPKNEDAFYEALAAKSLGSDRVTVDQANKIVELAHTAQDLKEKDPGMFGISNDFLKAQNELNDYVRNLKQVSVGESIGKNAGVVVKNNLILGISTPLKTLIGQAENYFTDKIAQRFATLFTGDGVVGQSRDLVSAANDAAWETAKATGFRDNVASMESIDDVHMLNKGEDFGTPEGYAEANGALRGLESVTRKAAQISNKIAIDIEHNVVFTKVYQKSMFDAADLISSQIAKHEGLDGGALKARANEIFTDAVKIEPETAEGKLTRVQAQLRAARVTSTNDTWASTIAMAAKNALNEVSPDFPLGSILEPFAKIPANVIANGLDNAGLGLIPGTRDIFEGYRGLDTDDIEAKTKALIQLTNGIQRVGRVIGTTGLAALIVSKMSPSSFRTNQYGASFIKIGNTWVNTEYLPIIGPAIAGAAEAKQKGGGVGTHIESYLQGAGKSILSVPDYLSELTTADSEGIVKYGVNFATSFLTPALLKDIFEGGLKNIFSTDTALHVVSGAGVQTIGSYNAGVKVTNKASALKAAATRKAKGEK